MDLMRKRARLMGRFKTVFEELCSKYDHEFEESDVVDIDNMEVIEDHGFLTSTDTKEFGAAINNAQLHPKVFDATITSSQLHFMSILSEGMFRGLVQDGSELLLDGGPIPVSDGSFIDGHHQDASQRHIKAEEEDEGEEQPLRQQSHPQQDSFEQDDPTITPSEILPSTPTTRRPELNLQSPGTPTSCQNGLTPPVATPPDTPEARLAAMIEQEFAEYTERRRKVRLPNITISPRKAAVRLTPVRSVGAISRPSLPTGNDVDGSDVVDGSKVATQHHSSPPDTPSTAAQTNSVSTHASDPESDTELDEPALLEVAPSPPPIATEAVPTPAQASTAMNAEGSTGVSANPRPSKQTGHPAARACGGPGVCFKPFCFACQ